MREKLENNFMDSFRSIMPIAVLVSIISIVIGISLEQIILFITSSCFLIFGMTLFTTGADLSMVIIGENFGKSLVKNGKKTLVLISSFILGIFITIAEPDLTVLAKQLTAIPNYLTISMVGIGIGMFLLLSVIRIFKDISFKTIITITVVTILVLLLFTNPEFVAVAFDAGGVTTGPMGVPLMVAFGYGLTSIRSGKSSKSDSFGLCGISSLGPILIVLLMGLFFKTNSVYDTSSFLENEFGLTVIVNSFKVSVKDVFVSLTPILLLFVVFQLYFRNVSKRSWQKIIFGSLLTSVGLIIFLTGASAGFLKTGYLIGNIIGGTNYRYTLIPIGMIFGFIIVNAEPAIKILNSQISSLTEGSISEKLVNFSLSIGVCLSIGFAMLRVLCDIPITYFVVPGYIIATILTYKCPSVFTAIAFDSGGAASGPLTTSFLLPLGIGCCIAMGDNVMTDAFGVGALVSMMPIITIQILGIVYEYKIKHASTKTKFDEEIVEYIWGM